MKAIDFPEANVRFVGEDMHDLPCYRGNGLLISCFKLDEGELDKIRENGGYIWHVLWGQKHPPIQIMMESPLPERGDEILAEKPEEWPDDVSDVRADKEKLP